MVIEVRSNIIASQHAIHAAYGGVVPELACRSHIENLQPVIDAALEQAARHAPMTLTSLLSRKGQAWSERCWLASLWRKP